MNINFKEHSNFQGPKQLKKMNRQEIYSVFLSHGTPKKQNHHLTKPNTRTGFRIYIYIYIFFFFFGQQPK